MYRIGEFSRMLQLTVKALRYYDEASILVPSGRDKENGYRLYNEEDYEKAKQILLLRKLDFSISEVKEVLENCSGPDDLSYFLTEKKEQILERVKKDQALIRTIEDYITKQKKEEKGMEYEIKKKTYEPLLVAAIRYTGRYGDAGKYFGKLFGAVKSKAAGVPFNCYFDGEYKETDADIEACLPIREPVTAEGIETKRLPQAHVLAATHNGSYETIGAAYKALSDYAAGHQIKLKTPCRETYLKGPGLLFRGNPDKYVTEVAMEIETDG